MVCLLKVGGKLFRVVKICMLMIDLLFGVIEDWICGVFDLEKVLVVGEKDFEFGFLVVVNCGFFYIDEVNFLEDYLVDFLFDVVVFGVNVVECEGFSICYVVWFVLVGSGNLEEGDFCL